MECQTEFARCTKKFDQKDAYLDFENFIHDNHERYKSRLVEYSYKLEGWSDPIIDREFSEGKDPIETRRYDNIMARQACNTNRELCEVRNKVSGIDVSPTLPVSLDKFFV